MVKGKIKSRGRATKGRVARNGNCPEAEAWVRVAEQLDTTGDSGLCNAVATYVEDVDLCDLLHRRLAIHRKAHNPGGWGCTFVYEGWPATALPQNKEARVLACLWMALEAAEEYDNA